MQNFLEMHASSYQFCARTTAEVKVYELIFFARDFQVQGCFVKGHV